LTKANYIYTTYLNGSNSVFEINVNRNICENIHKLLTDKNETNKKNNLMKDDFFLPVEKNIRTNLVDTICRFEMTKIFINYKNKKNDDKLLQDVISLNKKNKII
jgi:hypothetical protein